MQSPRVTCAALLAACLTTGTAAAQPLRTWGGQETPPETTTPTSTSTSTPTPTSAPTTPPEESEPEPTEPIVRAPGKVGLRYLLEGVEVRGNSTTLARVVLRYVRFRAGDTLDVDDKELELTRFRLLGTGFFQDVRLSLRRGSRRGYAILVISVIERNTIVINDLWLGLSADADPSGTARPLTAYGGIDVSETNLAGTGVTLGGALALAENQLGLRARFADPQFLGTEWIAETQLLYNKALDFFGNRDVLVDYATQQVAQDYAVVSYQRFGGYVGAGHDLSVSTRIYFDYRLEKLDATLPLAASHHRGLDIEPIDFFIHDGTSVLSTVRTSLVHDTRDDPILPTKGRHVQLVGDASLTPLGSDYPYVKLTTSANGWLPLPWGHVLRLGAFVGTIFGDAPLFERFYVGDYTDLLPDRVLDLNFDRRAAPNFLNTDIVEIRYGQYAAKLDTEYRIPLYHGHRSIYGIDFFVSGGIYGVANQEDLVNHARGYTGFSTVPVDLTFNLGFKAETSVGGFSFGVSNFLGFIPVRGGTQ